MKRPNYFQNNSKNSLIEKYHLYRGEKLNWFQVTLRLERSIISIILPWVLFCTAYGILISFLYHLGLPIGFAD